MRRVLYLMQKEFLELRQEPRLFGIVIIAPLIQLTKAEIIKAGTALGVDYGMTHSCYDPDAAGRACGHCDACQLRREGFRVAGLADPTHYSSSPTVGTENP